MDIYNLLITLLWIVFIGFWILSAISAKKNVRRNTNGLAVRLVYVVLLVCLFYTQTYLHIPIFNSIPVNTVRDVIGVMLSAAGVAFAIWARVYLGKNWGMPMSVKENPELVTSGPYAFVRHPIYTGVLLAMLGSALVQSYEWFAVLVLVGVYFIYSATKEEKLMQSQFPDTYPPYKRSTKMLIPYIF